MLIKLYSSLNLLIKLQIFWKTIILSRQMSLHWLTCIMIEFFLREMSYFQTFTIESLFITLWKFSSFERYWIFFNSKKINKLFWHWIENFLNSSKIISKKDRRRKLLKMLKKREVEMKCRMKEKRLFKKIYLKKTSQNNKLKNNFNQSQTFICFV